MKRIAGVLLAFLLVVAGSVPAQTPGYTTVYSQHLQDSTGTLIAHATACYQPVTSTGAITSFRSGGTEGQTSSRAVCTPVLSGVSSISLADTTLTTPVNICYALTVRDTLTGNILLQTGYACLQPSGATWDLDNYTPNLPAGVTVQAGPTGATGAQGPPGLACPGSGQCSANTVNGVTNAALLTGADIGAKINSFGANGTLAIPDGTYNFSTPIVLAQTGTQQMVLRCNSRATVLNYTGSGAAITISETTQLQQVVIENCNLNGSGAANGAVGIYLHDTQNAVLSNVIVSYFSGQNVLGVGSIGTDIKSSDLLAGGVNLDLQNDATNGIASTANRMRGGSLQYGTVTNFWDQGQSTSNSGDSGNVLDGVTLEEHPPAPNAIIEGTWDDAIINSYVECLYQANSSNYYNVIVGNAPGSGYGSQTAQTASMFRFANNFAGTCQPGSGDTSATMYILNSNGLQVSGIRDAGYVAYGYIFASGGTNTRTSISTSSIGWGTALYENPPADALLTQDPGQGVVGNQSSVSANGVATGGGLNLNSGAWMAPFVSPINQKTFPQQSDGISPAMDAQFGNLDFILGYITGDGTNHGVLQQYATSKTAYYDLWIQPKGGNLVLGNSANLTTVQSSLDALANTMIGVAGSDITLGFQPATAGDSVFYVDNVANALRIYNGNQLYPLTYNNAGVLSAATGYTVGGSAPSGDCLVGNGTAFVPGACTGTASTSSGTSISLTTNGTSGAATLSAGVLNIPVYAGGTGSAASENAVTSATTALSPTATLNTVTLSGNYTFTLAAGAAGATTCLQFIQGSTAYTVTGPSNVRGFFTVGSIANGYNQQCFTYSASRGYWLANSTGVVNY